MNREKNIKLGEIARKRELDEEKKQKLEENLTAAAHYYKLIDDFLKELTEYSNKEHTPEDVKELLLQEQERTNEKFDGFILKLMARVRKEMDWLDSSNIKNIIMTEKSKPNS